ncbi:hypothetical protein FACS1894216_19590 [Synergistales bacterium]|nr:hypothetical protein FACS1894216_19590 [Synergistales bacterium]
MSPHPEGGYFAQSYVSDGEIPASALNGSYRSGRRYSTAIYYLLREGEKSHFHRLCSDEVWHFYKGGPLKLVMIDASGAASEVVLGCDIESGQRPQFAVRAGTWFGAAPMAGSGCSLVGCTAAPGFEYEDFELATAEGLRALFPNKGLDELIEEFCR